MSLSSLFKLAATVVSLYSTLCFVRIILTWFPGASQSSIGRFFSSLCDPYMNLFSRLPLRLGMFDFSPILSLGLLTVISSILNNIALSGRICVSDIISFFVQLIWSVFYSFAFILLIIFAVRLIVLVFVKSSNSYNSPWQRFDDAIRSIVFRIASIFTGGRPISYQSALTIDLITMIFLLIVGRILISLLIHLIQMIPF